MEEKRAKSISFQPNGSLKCSYCESHDTDLVRLSWYNGKLYYYHEDCNSALAAVPKGTLLVWEDSYKYENSPYAKALEAQENARV